MSFKTYTGKPFNGHVWLGRSATKVFVNGVQVYPEQHGETKFADADDLYGFNTYLTSVFLNTVGEVPYEQQWSDNQPSQHNTPVPLDSTGLETSIISVDEVQVYQYTGVNSDSAGLETGLVSVVEENANI